jgi:hypothetical protein
MKYIYIVKLEIISGIKITLPGTKNWCLHNKSLGQNNWNNILFSKKKIDKIEQKFGDHKKS